LMGDSTLPARYSFGNDTSHSYLQGFIKTFDPAHTGRAGDPAGYHNGGGSFECTTTCEFHI